MKPKGMKGMTGMTGLLHYTVATEVSGHTIGISASTTQSWIVQNSFLYVEERRLNCTWYGSSMFRTNSCRVPRDGEYTITYGRTIAGVSIRTHQHVTVATAPEPEPPTPPEPEPETPEPETPPAEPVVCRVHVPLLPVNDTTRLILTNAGETGTDISLTYCDYRAECHESSFTLPARRIESHNVRKALVAAGLSGLTGQNAYAVVSGDFTHVDVSAMVTLAGGVAILPTRRAACTAPETSAPEDPE